MSGPKPSSSAMAPVRHTRMMVLVALGLGLIARDGFAEGSEGQFRWFGQLEFHASILSDLGDRSMAGTTFGPAGKAGYRWDRWGVFVSVEHNAWVMAESGQTGLRPGALNVGLGAELIYGYRYLRASVAVGPSILLYQTGLDPAGTTGVYLDLRPAGIRWPLADWFTLMFDPISLAIVAPVLTGIPLILAEYRTTLTTEFRW